jgi:NAD(P)-dependent dehydrogenase (short-subunit alcohol dehydrogenase family)
MILQGKRAIVLGGTSGIGLAATNQLASGRCFRSVDLLSLMDV